MATPAPASSLHSTLPALTGLTFASVQQDVCTFEELCHCDAGVPTGAALLRKLIGMVEEDEAEIANLLNSGMADEERVAALRTSARRGRLSIVYQVTMAAMRAEDAPLG